MGKAVVYVYDRVLFSHKEAQNYAIAGKMDETGDYHIKLNKLNSER